MKTIRNRKRYILLAAATLIGAVHPPMATSEEPGVSHALAIARAARLSNVRYSLNFKLQAHAATTVGGEILSFADSGSGDLVLDYRDGTVTKAVLNHKPIPIALENGHLTLPGTGLLKGENLLQIEFESQVAAAGKAITRYTDKDDGNEYIYTLFVPMDASMAFPCFDQPDLKARFSLDIDAPKGWTVIGNTTPTRALTAYGALLWSFPETRPISTYLFAFAAGPWAKLPGAAPNEPAIYVRQSQLARAKAEAPQVQQIAARGIHYLEDYFQQPFPFPKYDIVLIPGFPFGGMEHAGATFLNEDGVLFRSTPTASDYFRRNTLVLHETTHQWFGDLVTMRWFDDLWLKEGFAQYMAYKALADLEPSSNPWKHFYEEIKPAAYAIDETQGTTPISQHIANLKDAKSAYGAIVYQKAPAVLKQLNFFLGEENFRDGLRLYLKQHAYANAQWSDLVDAFAKTGHKDVQAWARAWILQRGMPEVTANWGCDSIGWLGGVTLRQHDVLNTKSLWPISNEIVLVYSQPQLHMERLRVTWSKAETRVRELDGKSCPDFIFTNDGDYGYGRFLLDATSVHIAGASLAPMSKEILKVSKTYAAPVIDDPLLKSMLWGALWENVHVASWAPGTYVQIALDALPTESDESLNRIQGGRIATALHAYLGSKGKAAILPQAEQVIADRMLHAPTLGLRIVNFRTFTSIAETPTALAQIKDLLAGKLVVPGLTLKPLDRWNLIGHLIAMADPEADTILAAEKAHDKSGEGQKYAYAVEAGTPSPAVKARYFNEYLHSQTIQEDWLTQSLRPFNSWNQTALTEPYLTQALNALPDIKLHRKIFFLGAWLGAFVEGQNSEAAQTAIHTWLTGQSIDPDLRLKVLEVSDSLDRTVLIRRTFPD